MKRYIRSAEDRITELEDKIFYIQEELRNPDLPDDERVDLQLHLEELEDELNFAWQDDEAEWDYARQAQEFNPDGSLKLYGSSIVSERTADVYVKIDDDWELLFENIPEYTATAIWRAGFATGENKISIKKN